MSLMGEQIDEIIISLIAFYINFEAAERIYEAIVLLLLLS